MAKKEWEELKKRLEFSERKRAFLEKRLSKGSIEEDSTLWSFVDLMTLLLILFILFYSHALARKESTENPPSFQPQASVTQCFEIQDTPVASEPIADHPNEPQQDVSEIQPENPDASLEQLQQQVLQAVSREVENDFSIRWNQKRLVLVLGERIAFNVGEADLLPDFQPTLKRIAGFISSQEGYKIAVAGHTDDKPIHTTRFPSNWELSAIRAVNVAKFMIASGVNPQRVSIQGYSAYRPLQANTTPHNRQANRRVEITLIKESESAKSDEKKTAAFVFDKKPKSQNPADPPTYTSKADLVTAGR